MPAENTETRKLAAIMFTDMVGYSTLSQRNEKLAQELLEEHRAILRPLFTRFNGAEIKTIGDAFLVEFHSALEAAQCGIEIQRSLAKRNHDVPADRRVEIKIGIHIGDVVHRGGDVYGDGVNIASRIEPLAGAGGICVSMDVERQIRSALEARFEKLAPTELKNISVAMDLFRIILPWESQTPKPATASQSFAPIDRPSADPKSVAVLAFANLSGDKENEYFSDGISEELLNVLAKIQGLKVTARTSAFHFKGKDTPIPEIARQLGVAYVVEGSVRKSGGRVRITAQLIKAADGFHVWSDTFTRDLEDIFAVQDEIAGLIAKNLELKLGTNKAHKAPVNPEAYQLALQGRSIYNRDVPDDYPLALRCYEESLRIDPESALTWAWLAELHSIMGGFGSGNTGVANEQVRLAAGRAIALDPELSLGHACMGMMHIFYEYDWARGAAALRQAAELAPGDSSTMRLRGALALTLGRCEEAVELYRQSLDSDPLDWLKGFLYGRTLVMAGRYAEAEKFAGHLISLHPAGYLGMTLLATVLLLQGRFDESAATAEKIPHRFRRLVALALARHSQGRPTESEATLQTLKDDFKEHGAYQIAEVHAWRGETDAAFQWLETAWQQHDAGIPVLRCDLMLTRLHGDVRWKRLLRQMNLADDQLEWARSTKLSF